MEIIKRVRVMYGVGNMIIRKFSMFHIEKEKKLTFRTYCSNVCCCSLLSSSKVITCSKGKISLDIICRSVQRVPRYYSASTLLVQYQVNNIDAVVHINIYSLIMRPVCSARNMVEAVYNNKVRINTHLAQLRHQITML